MRPLGITAADRTLPGPGRPTHGHPRWVRAHPQTNRRETASGSRLEQTNKSRFDHRFAPGYHLEGRAIRAQEWRPTTMRTRDPVGKAIVRPAALRSSRDKPRRSAPSSSRRGSRPRGWRPRASSSLEVPGAIAAHSGASSPGPRPGPGGEPRVARRRTARAQRSADGRQAARRRRLPAGAGNFHKYGGDSA